MPLIHLTTFIAAPAEVVFDLSRHIGLHKEAMSEYREDAVAGTRMGMIEKGETVTWKARHFWKNRLLRVKVSEMVKHEMYVTEQLEGNFKSMRHEHYFKPCENGMLLIDLLHYEAPYGVIGRWFNSLYLARYLKKLLEKHNQVIKQTAEGERWKMLLLK